jgi:hypothetical protein
VVPDQRLQLKEQHQQAAAAVNVSIGTGLKPCNCNKSRYSSFAFTHANHHAVQPVTNTSPPKVKLEVPDPGMPCYNACDESLFVFQPAT